MYTVIEIQTTNGTTSAIMTTNLTREVAYQKFHTILAAAAVSSVGIHTAVILNDHGYIEKTEYFEHDG